MSELQSILHHIDKYLNNSIERWFELLRIPSISTDPAYKIDCYKAADWIVQSLTDMGFNASIRETAGQPIVIAHHHHTSSNTPHILFYGHYDVQPVDPIELWDTPPFEPTICDKNGRKYVVARGADDNKGQMLTFIEACRAYLNEMGKLPLNVSIFIEGEEECGSPSTIPFLQEVKDEIKADIILVCDTNMFDEKTPAIVTTLRGLLYEEVTIKAASRDLHSGYYGGPAQNPIRVLSRILAELHDEQGHITIPGFYNGVIEPDLATKAEWQQLNFDEKAYLQDVGLSVPAGEQSYTVLEQVWARPSCDINGIWGGYTGKGAKTVIPSEASAKVSFRLVGQQDPYAVQKEFRSFVKNRLPEDCVAEFQNNGAEAAVSFLPQLPEIAKAYQGLTQEWSQEAVFIGMGGSIPIIGAFQRILGINALLVGFGLDDDCIHSPNEKYNIMSFHKGIRSWARIIEELSK